MKIAIYTALFANKDILRVPLNFSESATIDYIVFTDADNIEVLPYKVHVRKAEYEDMAKCARYFKIIGDPILNNYDLILWHDANIQINHTKILDLLSYTTASFLTTFTHPNRDDFYSEAMSCIRTDKDYSLRLLWQCLVYFFKGMPAHRGMYSTGILIKNQKFKNELLLLFWWQQTLKYSRRDQLSLAFTLFKTKSELKVINENIFDNIYSVYHLHIYVHYIEQKNIMQYNYEWLKKLSFIFVKLLRKLKKI